ncbi:ASCH domain-containing protein [Micromonospora cremea]|uniref:Cytidine deaminase n=1 Tax=Micromonospora cremea TaxID=709881 RepID=A0A1N6BFG9_9ACTN|nr:ASCH domain-containing protein [Micromonospora cremea]SIN45063.1 cytidine deaminase [Micromonospora cremea]
MLEKIERRLVAAAEAVVRSPSTGDAHTVAAAAMDANGDIYSGVNVFHFTGGPCAELVVIGSAAAANAPPLITIVAVGDGDRGVIAPCGRCRQVMLDLHPDVFVIVPTGDGQLAAKPVRELLPFGYVARTGSTAPRVVYFHPRHYDTISSGLKTATVRFQDSVQTGPAVFVFDDGESIRRLDAVVEKVESRRLDHLTEEDAHHEALPDSDALRDAIKTQYPMLGDGDVVDVATFRLTAISAPDPRPSVELPSSRKPL